jgi:hypothetical protein
MGNRALMLVASSAPASEIADKVALKPRLGSAPFAAGEHPCGAMVGARRAGAPVVSMMRWEYTVAATSIMLDLGVEAVLGRECRQLISWLEAAWATVQQGRSGVGCERSSAETTLGEREVSDASTYRAAALSAATTPIALRSAGAAATRLRRSRV